ncbi:hypothetical protein DTO027I6_3055 [Penicillium roqueforti]|uniref:uncharacterized protein n=1 Tax=Penicillium roqueforti TaxID=5082 RepID=UPI00190990DA|nr:uncharacterized protein LCP9604111_139 [Penicillium roqueforti]KAF9252613.1 hypothetical protein LCP9604111_139 [Penicillium roqueforti]KAI1835674.1 hypothetical protein CBS147337_3697 [Penicillium roqueforti]KAI2675475.1 hypothetical protein CBS147355_6469 [Penicillium roqueforti]KAI2687090.1 hypothetical protein LCP963914a_3691 [Penicillium roqueforti]KAI2698434.1 hypothetical protein CBS147372_6964 [Penicillium roqueforti]
MARITGSRMTRSRSREANAAFMPNKGSLERNWLSGLAEEPSAPPIGFIAPRDVVPESPENQEGNTNVSGTTLCPNDAEPADSRVTDARVADKIATHLPFVQQQATLVMSLLVHPDFNPDSLAAESKKLLDSGHPNRKRLRRFVEGLIDELEDCPLSRDGKSLLDVSQARRLLSPAQLDASITYIYMTNCALLTLNMFLPSIGTESQSEVIQQLDSQFPACVLGNLPDSSTPKELGASDTSEATFNLALSIRTQFFIMELERRQDEQDFSPLSILRQVFAIDLIPSEDYSQDIPGSFRGFNLPGVFQDEDGHLPENLPEKFLIAVNDRFNELHEELSEWDSVDIGGLKKAYRWRSFERDLARWIYVRDSEIKEDIRRLSERVHSSSTPRRLTSVPVGTPNRRVSTVPPSPQKDRLVSMAPDAGRVPPSPQKERLVSMAPDAARVPQAETTTQAGQTVPVDKLPENNAPRPSAASQNVPEKSVSDQVARPAAKDPGRRKSKSNYRDPASFAALMRRQATSHQQPVSNESQAQTISTKTSIVAHVINPGLTASRATEAFEIQQSPELGYTDIGDDSTYVNNDEDLDLGHGPGPDVIISTSPPNSARISHVSHNPTPRLSDSPRDGNPQRSVPIARRFLDKQNNARVVSPISQYDTQSTVLGKRNRNADVLDDDSTDGSDDEFEQYNHNVDPRRRVEKSPHNEPAAKRHHPQDTAWSGGEQSQSSINRLFHHNQSSQTQVSRRIQAVESDDAATDEETTVAQLEPPPSTQGRWAASQAAMARRRVPKTSHRWTDEEDERLLHLMSIYGTAFATIKKQDNACPPAEGGPVLERRSQVNCKDRARNLKRKYLREGRTLPPNLDKAAG